MKVRIEAAVKHDGKPLKVGAVLELDDEVAARLVVGKFASAVDDGKAKKEADK